MNLLTKTAKAAKKREAENKKIEKRNAKFRAMSKTKQRVAIAKEVLSLLKPSSGVKVLRANGYFMPKFSKENSPAIMDDKDPALTGLDWQRLLPKAKTCEVCAIGMAAVASVRLRDGMDFANSGVFDQTVGGVDGFTFTKGECVRNLGDLFTDYELNEMESFFECNSFEVSAQKSIKLLWTFILERKGKFAVKSFKEWLVKAEPKFKGTDYVDTTFSY